MSPECVGRATEKRKTKLAKGINQEDPHYVLSFTSSPVTVLC
jgi:hypothetical protein